MARKQKHPEHVNHERWLVSYADFITLLFAFFVVMFAVSQVDSKKVGRFTESFSAAMGIDLILPAGSGFFPGVADKPGLSKGKNPPASTPTLADIELVFSKPQRPELAGLTIVRRRNEVVIRFPDQVLFDSGDDRVKERASRTLRAIAEEVRSRPLALRVEGHTDDVPMRNGRFRSNWELSTSRATAVIELIATIVPPERLAAAGYGEVHPVAPNDTPEGRAQNRRVDLVVLFAAPEEPAGPDPHASSGEEEKKP